MIAATDFWASLEKLASECEAIIDRPRGSAHPNWPQMIYPLDYGYLAGSKSSDGNEIDIWLGTMTDKRLTAIVVTVDTNKRDTEVKLLLGCTEDDISTLMDFHNSGYQNAIVLRRDG